VQGSLSCSKQPSLVFNLSKLNPVHTPRSCFFKMIYLVSHLFVLLFLPRIIFPGVFTSELNSPVQFSMRDVYRPYEGTCCLNVRAAGSSKTSISIYTRLLGLTLQKTGLCDYENFKSDMKVHGRIHRSMPRTLSSARVTDPYPHNIEQGSCIRCSDWLRAGRPRGRNSGPGSGKFYMFSTSSRPVLGPPSPLYNVYQGFFLRS
jgi:hypothetical protein